MTNLALKIQKFQFFAINSKFFNSKGLFAEIHQCILDYLASMKSSSSGSWSGTGPGSTDLRFQGPIMFAHTVHIVHLHCTTVVPELPPME